MSTKNPSEKENVYHFSRLISDAPGWEEVSKIVDRMESVGVQPNILTFHNLIKKIIDWRQSFWILERMNFHEVRPTPFTFELFIRKTKTWEQAVFFLNAMNKLYNIRPTFDIFDCVADKSSTIAHMFSTLEEMADKGIWPEARTFCGFMSNIQNWDDLLRIYNIMLTYQLQPNSCIFSLLSRAAFEPSQIFFVIQQMILHGVLPELYIFNLLIDSVESWNHAFVSFNFLMQCRHPNIETFNCLISKTETTDQIFYVLKLMSFYNYPIEEITHQLLEDKNIYFCKDIEPATKH